MTENQYLIEKGLPAYQRKLDRTANIVGGLFAIMIIVTIVSFAACMVKTQEAEAYKWQSQHKDSIIQMHEATIVNLTKNIESYDIRTSH